MPLVVPAELPFDAVVAGAAVGLCSLEFIDTHTRDGIIDLFVDAETILGLADLC
jgi:hypothetical protein